MNRRGFLIALGASLALLALWFVFLWGPQGGRLSDAQARTEAAEAQNQELELRIQRLEAAQEGAPARMAELAALRRAVPDDPELAQFILDANQAASEAGVDFLSITPGVPSPGVSGLPPVITLGITVTGPYFAVLDYLERIDDLPRIVVIDGLNLTPQDEPGQLQQLTVNVTGRMFATSAPQLPPPTTVPPAPGETTTTTVVQPVSSVGGSGG